MEKVWDKAVRGLAACGGAIAGMMGGWDPLLRVLVTLMAVDYVTGVLVAVMGKSAKTEYGGLSSKVGAMGLARKGLMLTVVLVAAMVDSVIGAGSAMCRDAACWFYIANEGISILENAGLAGAPYPAKLRELLGQKQKEGEKQDGVNT